MAGPGASSVTAVASVVAAASAAFWEAVFKMLGPVVGASPDVSIAQPCTSILIASVLAVLDERVTSIGILAGMRLVVSKSMNPVAAADCTCQKSGFSSSEASPNNSKLNRLPRPSMFLILSLSDS